MSTKKFIKTLVFAMSAVILSHPVLAGNGNWGLGFPNPGSTPTGAESKDYLANYNSYFIANENEKTIYLTFDAGYENGYTVPILDVLKKNNVPATFFLVGSYIKNNPEIVNRMVQEGHIVGNHTISHPDMTKISDPAAFAKQLTDVEDIYKSVTGQEMKKLYRPPQGKYSEANLKMANDLGYKTVFWSLAYMDFDDKNQPTKEAAFGKLIPRIHSGAIVLLHNTSKTNSLILDELIQKYRDMGYEFGSLEALGDKS